MSKKDQPKKAKVHKDLDGFDVSINTFGEIKSNINIDQINAFLNQNVDDKKLRDREDLEEIKRKKPTEND